MTDVVHLSYRRRPSSLRYLWRGVMPVRRTPDLNPRIVATWRNHRADPRDLASVLAITGLPAGPDLPLLYPHVFGFRLAMAVLTHPAFPVPIWGVLQTRNHLVHHRPIPVQSAMDLECRVLAGRSTAKGAEFDLRTTVHAGRELAWESLVTFFTRGRFGEPAPESPHARSPTEFGSLATEWTPRNAGHWRFGGFTGDYNGIHLWDAYARRLGFPRALFHPQRVLGECLSRLPGARGHGTPQQLDAWLKGPVPHDTPVRLHAASGTDQTTFALFVEPERPCVVGRLTGPRTGC
jgi:hypothetical protein